MRVAPLVLMVVGLVCIGGYYTLAAVPKWAKPDIYCKWGTKFGAVAEARGFTPTWFTSVGRNETVVVGVDNVNRFATILLKFYIDNFDTNDPELEENIGLYATKLARYYWDTGEWEVLEENQYKQVGSGIELTGIMYLPLPVVENWPPIKVDTKELVWEKDIVNIPGIGRVRARKISYKTENRDFYHYEAGWWDESAGVLLKLESETKITAVVEGVTVTLTAKFDAILKETNVPLPLAPPTVLLYGGIGLFGAGAVGMVVTRKGIPTFR